MQYFFDFHGPFETLNGLIIWYQRKGTGFTGLFNNKNYLACWLSVILPLTISQFIKDRSNPEKSFFTFIFSIYITIAIFLTESFDSILGLWPGLILLLFNKVFINWLTIMIFSSLLVFLSNKALIEYLNSVLIYINDRINLFEIFYRLEERLGIFKEAIHLIYQNPIFGLGAGRINDIVINDKSYILHTHNLFYELAYNYGLLAATPIIITILLLFYKSFTNIYNLSITKQQAKLYKPISIIDKSWFVAFLLY